MAAVAAISPQAHLIALLGGEVGLRSGEMRALTWTDVDFAKRQVCVSKSVWRGQGGLPKGNRIRYVPLTHRAAAALHAAGTCAGRSSCIGRMGARCRSTRCGISCCVSVGWRTSSTAARTCCGTRFCSHLIMRGALVTAVKDLAGHRDISTTMRYVVWGGAC